MIRGQDVVIISSIEWSFLWQGPQEIACRLAQAGNNVLYVENTGVRSPGLRDARRVAARLSRWAGAFAFNGLRSIAPGLNVCSPVVLPPLGGPWRRQLNRKAFLPIVARTAASLKMRDPLILTFLPTDTAVDLINLLRGEKSLVVYYCVADFAELCSNPARLLESQRELLESSDLVFAQCTALATQCDRWAKDVHIIPYGVNLGAFLPTNGSGANGNGHNHLPRPVIGYVGGLHRHVDLHLLTQMAQSRPEWSWVCVGPTQTRLGSLETLPNVHLLGEVQHKDLGHQIERFDVGIVPYVKSSYTDTVVPTKINEYLAMGKPVVSTALPAVCDYYSWPRVVIPCEPTLDDFLGAIETALVWPNNHEMRAMRRDIAKLNDWTSRLEHICELIENAAKHLTNGKDTSILSRAASAGTTG
jgi:glycosyltransferase involved in cell wall biosynthesis